jgi:DNA-directed RNA polymerase
VRTRTTVGEELPKINKMKSANAIAPNYVHSMDACHLMAVVNACAYRGIHSYALIHDSFGCHAADAKVFRETIQTEFYGLYQHDVLQNIYDEACKQLTDNHDKLLPAPTKGNYNISEVLNAEYAFS